ncbi:MAG: thiamine phosphate synthase [Acidobacteria bacterium]|nr:thiamine phosphate synthase [Acidobacteriota bacterium]
MILPRLYAIVDMGSCARVGRDPLDVGRAYLAGGARLLQLRAKGLPSGAFLELATLMAADAQSADARLIVNDRSDVATLAGAHGVHVGQDDLSPRDVRRIVGGEALVGLSTHTSTQVEAALLEPVSYVAVGPVFDTTTKGTGDEAVGPDLVRVAVGLAARRVPIVAIGGLTLERAGAVIEAGADAVAVISDLLHGDIEARVRQWVTALERGARASPL